MCPGRVDLRPDHRAIEAELDGAVVALAEQREKDSFYASIAAAARTRPDIVKVTAKDLPGSASVLCLVLATAPPAAYLSWC